MAAETALDRILNIVIPIAALLFFAALFYRNPNIRGMIDLIFGWIKAIFDKGKEKVQDKKDELDEEGMRYFPRR